jgi:biopolymer transport protein ExbB
MFSTVQFFSSFGPIAYLLLLSSIVILAISIERIITMYTQTKIPVKKLHNITNFIRLGNLAEAKKYSTALTKPFSQWVDILLNYPAKLAEEELNLIISQKRISLQRPLDWLNLFAITSPMLGLLGTIWSMSHSFKALDQSLNADGMHKMITYLAEAMYATAFGIILAIMSMLFLYFLRQKSEKYLSKCEYVLNLILLALAHNSHKKDITL